MADQTKPTTLHKAFLVALAIPAFALIAAFRIVPLARALRLACAQTEWVAAR